MSISDFCSSTGVPRSVMYDWKKKQVKGKLKYEKPGRKKGGVYALGWLTVEMVKAYLKSFNGNISNYALGKIASISESSVRRIRKENEVKTEKGKTIKRKPKYVHWKHIHACWSIDTMYVKVKEGRAYLILIVDERSRNILASRLCPKIDGETAARVISDTIRGIGEVPVHLKFDRGSEFNNPAVLNLLLKEGVTPLPSPRRYPRFNGKLERINRMVKGKLESKGVMSFEQTQAEIDEIKRFINQEYPWRIFNGKTSDTIYYHSGFVSRAVRKHHARRVVREFRKIWGRRKKRMDVFDAARKAAVKTSVNAGLVYINNQLPDVEIPKLSIHDIIKKRKLDINVAPGYDRFSPESDPVDGVKEDYNRSPMREVFEIYKKRLNRG